MLASLNLVDYSTVHLAVHLTVHLAANPAL
jgi:hypothetical protein